VNLSWLSLKEVLHGVSEGLSHPSGQAGEAAKAGSYSRLGAVLGGDPGCGERGSIDQAVVLNDRFDCRSRQAARGLRDPGRTARAIEEDLALLWARARLGERASEAGPRRQSRGIGGGWRLRM